MFQMHAMIKGKVQGVFFRSTVKKIADQLHINGYVKNLPDNTVEIVANGEKDELEIFIERIKKNPGKANIFCFDCDFSNVVKSFESFEIR